MVLEPRRGGPVRDYTAAGNRSPGRAFLVPVGNRADPDPNYATVVEGPGAEVARGVFLEHSAGHHVFVVERVAADLQRTPGGVLEKLGLSPSVSVKAVLTHQSLSRFRTRSQ